MSYQSDVAKADRIQSSGNFPKVVLLDNTSACNLRCSMCDHRNIHNYRPIQRMPIELYRRIIDEVAVKRPDARIWEIFFGDPFLCPDMPERIGYAKDKGLTDVVVNTNGVLMKPDAARKYIEAGLDAIYVGVDAASGLTYNKVRVGGDYTAAVSNILAYRDLLKSVGSPQQKIFVQFVVSDVNEREVEDFKAFWSSEGVHVKIRPKISWAGLIDAENLADNASVSRKPCYWLMQTINICADGRVALCSVDLHCRVPCGDINIQSVEDVWINSALAKYRNIHCAGNFSELPDMCRTCRDWQSAYADYVTA